MTTTSAESATPTAIPTFASPEAQVLYPLALTKSEEHNTLAETLRTESVTQQKIKEVINTNEKDDDKITGLSDEIDLILNSLKAKRDELNDYVRDAYFAAETISKDERDRVKKELSALKESVSNIVKVGNSLTNDDFGKTLPPLTKLTGLTGEATGRGAGVLRPRIGEAYVNGEKVTNAEGKSTFGVLRKKIAEVLNKDVNTKELHVAALESAGLSYEDGFEKYPDDHTFTYEGVEIRTVAPA